MAYKEDPLETELSDLLKVCCGPTSDALEHIRQTLSLMQKRLDASGGKDGVYEHICGLLDDHLGLNDRMAVGYVYLYHLENLGLTEHGCGIRGSWPTAAGREVLVKLETWAAGRSLG